MLKKAITIASLILVPALTIANETTEPWWWRVTDYSYIDAAGMTLTEDNSGYKFLLKAYNKGQYEPIHNTPVSYTISSYTIDCEDKTYKIGIIDSYDKDDKFLSGDYNKYAKLQPIVDGTAIEYIYNKLCTR